MRSLLVYCGWLIAQVAFAADPPGVVELFEDDTETLIPQLTNTPDDEYLKHKAEAEKTDVFAGNVALRVGSFQRFQSDIKGWAFPIVQRPKAGEYRFVRFAWRKTDQTSMMLQLASTEQDWETRWNHRYYVGPDETPRWSAKHLSKVTPQEWVVVTRDLFADFGAFTLSGIAFSPLDYGSDAIFDHVLLGRTLDELDQHSTATFKKTKPKKPLTAAELDTLWKQLGTQTDQTAYWRLLVHRAQLLPKLQEYAATIRPTPLKPVDNATTTKLIVELNHHQFLVRERAMKQLILQGEQIRPQIRAAVDQANDVARAMIDQILLGLDQSQTEDGRRLARVQRLLEHYDQADTKERAAQLRRQLTPANKNENQP